ncbi:hypothetical protein MMC10_007037 [Thelotrema lepadinum]|nr:hypothetical protein [Thelotrema lepadinum]
MDPVSALSLAASVIAVVQISKEAIDIYSDLLETGSVSQYEATEAAARSLESSIKDLREPLKDAAGSAQTHGDKYLVDLANKSTAIANDLQGVIEKLRRDPNGGIFDAIRKTYRAITKRKDIERKKKDLDEYEKALNTLILVQLRQGTSKSSQRYGEVLQKLSDLKVVIEGSNVGVAQADSDQSNLFALTSKFLDSLLFTDIYSRHEQITSAHKKTFGWIFNGFEGLNLEQPRKWANFVAWLERCDSSENMYWIQGKAGSGKSTLMSYLADHQKTHAALHVWCGKDSILLTPCFFFWNTGSILQKSVRGLLRSIIYQLLRGSKVLLTTLVAQSNQASPQILPIDYQMAWTEQRLFDLLDRILEMSEALGIYICFFLDGLDEYTGETDHLTKWILEVSTQSNVKICVSSRPEEAYRQAFLHKPQLRLQDLTHDDIAFLMDAVQQRASGVFLWVKLVVSDLLNGVTARETISQLQERLEEIPTEIQDLYAHMLKKLPKRFSSPGIRYLSMMLAASEFHGALQPECVKDLSVLDVAMADDIFWRKIIRYDLSSSVEQELDEYCDRLESHILCCCAGLVEFRGMRAAPGLLRHHLSTLDFIHRSVNEFLLSDASLLPPTAIAEAFVSFTRAKIGFCAWYFAGPLRYFAGSLRDAFPQVDYTERNSLLEDSLSLRQFATRGRSEVEGIESEMIGMALMLERKFSEDKEYESSVYNAFEDTSFHLFVFLKKCDRSLWNMQDSWTRERLGVSIDAKDDDSLCHLARLGFRSAVSYIQDCSPASTSYFDTIVDCILSSPGLEDEHIAVNQIQIAEAAFERGANCQRTVAITFLNGHEEMEIFLPCVQEAWAFLLWRATFRVWRMQAQSDRITELILKYVEYCLDKGASLAKQEY